ncbi:hypothetical protein LINPERHAP1_LOCUS36659 [Linum perenne]
METDFHLNTQAQSKNGYIHLDFGVLTFPRLLYADNTSTPSRGFSPSYLGWRLWSTSASSSTTPTTSSSPRRPLSESWPLRVVNDSNTGIMVELSMEQQQNAFRPCGKHLLKNETYFSLLGLFSFSGSSNQNCSIVDKIMELDHVMKGNDDFVVDSSEIPCVIVGKDTCLDIHSLDLTLRCCLPERDSKDATEQADKELMLSLGISKEEFHAITCFTSWAVNGDHGAEVSDSGLHLELTYFSSSSSSSSP